MSVQLKICGMRDPENIMEVARLRPFMMGFIFHPGSTRFVGNDFNLPQNFPSEIGRVGVFVNASAPEVLRQAERLRLDFVQLHGSETVQACCELKYHNIKIIKAFSIGTSFDFEVTKFYLDAVDCFLFDTKGVNPGGNGVPFDWSLLSRYRDLKPYFLSGGISPENVKGVFDIDDSRLIAIDVNSGAETSPGVKDPQKVKRIIDVLNPKKSHEI